MDEELFKKGLEKRKATLGKEYVEKNLEQADDFTLPFQKAMTEWCWGFGWCDDVKSKFYNKPIKTNINVRHEKLYRNDKKYDLLIPIEYNFKKPKKNKGSAIFLHLTSNYKKTQGCVAIKKKDMLILLKLIDKKTKIKII